ncbi:MAG TPA: hypothetical protein VL172_01045, partial [Kofleriaceae bacterium]|nr:hypothetical protein [Kofleriaceae bacterium]
MILLALRRLCDRPQHPDAEVLGQCERAALAAALRLRGELEATVTAVAVGPAQREDRVLAMALRAGCDEAVRVHDADLEDADYLGIAGAIAAVARRSGARLIICGDRSQDERQGATGPAIAELLGAPHLIQVVDLRAHDGALLATQRGGGQLHSWRCPLPAVMCMAGFPRSRHPTGDGTREGRGGGITELDLAKLGLDRTALAGRSRL